MKNVVQHVLIGNGDEMIVLNGHIILTSEQEDLSKAAANMKAALNGLLETESVEMSQNSDWYYDDVLELITGFTIYQSEYEIKDSLEELVLIDEIESDEFNQALFEIQSELSEKSGDFAARWFSGLGDRWSAMSRESRKDNLLDYVQQAKAYLSK
jgi:hypothetical protein